MARLLLLLLAVLATSVAGQRPRQRSYAQRPYGQRFIAQRFREMQAINEIDSPAIPNEDTTLPDPCADKMCSAGRSCVVNAAGEGVCDCVEPCEMSTDPRRRVCSNHNETWMSDCHLHRERCLCEDDRRECQDDMYAHLQIDYFGQCQQVQECTQEDLADFPRRMREWLFAVMRDMAARQLLASQYQRLEREAEADETQKWTNAVVWKWCEMDGQPKDRVVSRHELFPIRAPLHTLEHCISPFLDSCDPDDDHRITLKEWGNCLELNQEHIENMEDLCEDIRDPTNAN